LSSEAPILIENLVKDYGEGESRLRAVDHVSMVMRPGEILGLLGPNGAGKTSIISTIVTLEKPTAGRVSVFGFDVCKRPQQTKMLIGFVPQELIHHGYFDVMEILEFHSGYFGRLKNRDRIEWILRELALWDHRNKKVKQLSGGMKRRLLIAKALVHEPKLLILDEPTAGVDIELRESLWRFVGELKREGVAILLTTHYIEEAESLCDRIGILQKGKLLRLAATQELINELTKREIVVKLKGTVKDTVKDTVVPSHPYLVGQSNNELVFQVPSHIGAMDLVIGLGIELSLISDLTIRDGSLEEAMKRVLNDKTVIS